MSRSFYRVPSLTSLCMDYTVNNVADVASDPRELKYLPPHVKDKMLKRFLSSRHFWRKVEFKVVLKALVHRDTKALDLNYVADEDILDIISVCERLETLCLRQQTSDEVTAYKLARMFRYFPNMKTLSLARCAIVNDVVIEHIAKYCPKLSGLDLHSCLGVTSDSIQKIGQSGNLMWLTLSNTNVCDVGVQALVMGPSGKTLKELRLSDCPKLSGGILQIIAEHCDNIETLDYNDCAFFEGDPYQSNCEDSLTPMKHLKQFRWTVRW